MKIEFVGFIISWDGMNLKTNKIMGQLIIQKIYICDICGETPEDGGKLWYMGNEVWCEKCCEEAPSKIIPIDDE